MPHTSTSSRVSRARFASTFGESFLGPDGEFRRKLFDALGYKEDLIFEDFQSRYDRSGIAERIIDFYPQAVWSSGASVMDDEDPSVVTEFEADVKELFTRLSIWDAFKRGNILSRIGQYSILLIGAEGSLETELPSINGIEGVLYITPISEERAKIQTIEDDVSSPRLGLVKTYHIKISDTVTATVDWSRVIHLTNNPIHDRVYGKPVLRSVWNYLDDLDKLVGGGAEAAWSRMDPPTLFDLDPKAQVSAEDKDKMAEQFDEMRHGLRRNMRTRGITPHQLSNSTNTFSDNAETVIRLIAATQGIPSRILMGSETGERATLEDRRLSAERVDEIRDGPASIQIRDLIDRLVTAGALSKPDDEFIIKWPIVDNISEVDRSLAMERIAGANKSQKDASGKIIMTTDEIRALLLNAGPLENDDSESEGE